jgi:hypothetical protein
MDIESEQFEQILLAELRLGFPSPRVRYGSEVARPNACPRGNRFQEEVPKRQR